MQGIQDFFNQGWLGVVVGVLGLAAAYFFYRRSMQRTSLVYVSRSFQVVGRHSSFPSDLKILYQDREVERVTKTVIIFWNNGNVTINGSRIVDSDPLRLEVSEGERILDASVIGVTRAVNSCALSPGADPLIQRVLTFDYLDAGDGIAVSMLYTAEKEAHVFGTLRGVGGVQSLGKMPDAPVRNFMFVMSVVAIVCVLIIIFSFFAVVKNLVGHHGAEFLISVIGVSLVGLVLAGLGLLMGWREKRRGPPQVLLKEAISSVDMRKTRSVGFRSS